MDDAKQLEQNITVRVPDSVGTGVYATIVKVNITDNEAVLDFILNTNNPGEQAILVSRVVLSVNTAQQLSDILEALLRKRSQALKGESK